MCIFNLTQRSKERKGRKGSILPYLIVFGVIAIVSGCLAQTFCTDRKKTGDYKERTYIDDEIASGHSYRPYTEAEDIAGPTKGPMEYWDSLTSYGDAVAYSDWGMPIEGLDYDRYDGEVQFLLRTVAGVPKDTATVIGPWPAILGGGRYVKIVVGVDTLRIDISRRLPKMIDTGFADALPGCKKHRLFRQFAVNDTSGMSKFEVNIGLPCDSTPLWALNFLKQPLVRKIFV